MRLRADGERPYALGVSGSVVCDAYHRVAVAPIGKLRAQSIGSLCRRAVDPIRLGVVLKSEQGMSEENPSLQRVDGKDRLNRLSGAELAAITLVRDYVQFHFDGPVLNFYVWPVLHVDGAEYAHGAPGYLDAAESLIGRSIAKADATPQRVIEVLFADGSSFVARLDDDSRVTEASVEYFDDARKQFASW